MASSSSIRTFVPGAPMEASSLNSVNQAAVSIIHAILGAIQFSCGGYFSNGKRVRYGQVEFRLEMGGIVIPCQRLLARPPGFRLHLNNISAVV